MAVICIIDDRVKIRETLENKIKLILKRKGLEWNVISHDPFINKEEYISFIKTNDISILILDERLHEVGGNDSSVDYNGSELVIFLREIFKDFPIYSITSYSDDENLENQFSQFDEIIAREVFHSRAEEYVLRFVRAGQRFLENNKKHLFRLSELSELIAKGLATKENIEELRVIQELLNIPFHNYDYPNQEIWLDDYSKNISDLSALNDEIEQFLKNYDNVEKNS
ncbi:DNA-binding transcriptional response regulator [Elizabethkingia occulta]|uniref:hypothetical protein n=1 Tax=Elizabethkingia occulta TaxID=1867263 RepID=UPI00398C8250